MLELRPPCVGRKAEVGEIRIRMLPQPLCIPTRQIPQRRLASAQTHRQHMPPAAAALPAAIHCFHGRLPFTTTVL